MAADITYLSVTGLVSSSANPVGALTQASGYAITYNTVASNPTTGGGEGGDSGGGTPGVSARPSAGVLYPRS